MDSVVRWMGGRWRPARAAAVAALACSVGACASLASMVPDWSSFRLPDRSTFLPTRPSFNYKMAPTTPVGPADLVNGQGQCAAAPPAQAAAEASSHGVSLDMTECEVIRALGQPQSIDASRAGASPRRIVMTYRAGERPGIYEFSAGRLKDIESVDEPPPAVRKKRAAKKSKTHPRA